MCSLQRCHGQLVYNETWQRLLVAGETGGYWRLLSRVHTCMLCSGAGNMLQWLAEFQVIIRAGKKQKLSEQSHVIMELRLEI